MTRKAGRPKQPTEARKQLIHHARELFTVMAYEKVSTRLIAQKAGVNSALIRYYFGNKEGLFETMLRETLAPIQAQLVNLAQQSDSQHLSELMRTYYREMGKVPKFPRLIWQVMNLPASETQRQLMEKVFADISQPMQAAVFNSLSQQGVLRSDTDPQMSRISFLSLMVFPFLAPASMLAIHGVELDEAFLTRLADHNLALLTHGLLEPAPEQSESRCH